MEKIIVIGGATGSGKSSLAIDIARTLDTEIISADSMQIYKGMDIGTAKVTTEEMAGIRHHMLDVVSPRDNFSVSLYVDMARDIISRLNSEGKVPVVVGGTGLYIDALLYDYSFNGAGEDVGYREELREIALTRGNEYLHHMLEEIDPIEAKKTPPNNVKRVIRALEIYHLTGKRKSDEEKVLHYDTLMLIKHVDRSILYENIDRRVDDMIASGLDNEVKRLIDAGISFDSQAMLAIGYREWRDYFEGNATLEDIVDNIKRDTRHYAKRQITWFYNKYHEIAHLIGVSDREMAIELARSFAEQEGE